MELKKMTMKVNLILIIIISLSFCVSLVYAAEINTTSYDIDSTQAGTSGGNLSTTSYTGTSTTTDGQPTNRDTATTSYSASSGWLDNAGYINTDSLPGEGGETPDEPEDTETQETPGGLTGKIIREIERKEVEGGIIKGIKEFEKIKFSFMEGELEHFHYIEALDIKEDSVLIVIYPDENTHKNIERVNKSKSITGEMIYTSPKIEFEEPITFRLYLKEAKQLDLTGDGYRDIYIRLEEIKNSEAFIYIEAMYEFIDEESKIKEASLYSERGKELPSWALIILFLVFGLIIFLCYLKKRRGKKKRIEFKVSFKFASLGLGVAILLIVLIIMRASITGAVIGAEKIIGSLFGFFFISFIIGAVGLVIFLHRKNIRRLVEAKQRNRHSKDSLKGLIKKKVYTDDGDYVGKVEEIILGENKIDSLKIKLDKRFKKMGKGIVAKYRGVKDTGHIVIVNRKIMEKIEK